jgi:hypothetical protein
VGAAAPTLGRRTRPSAEPAAPAVAAREQQVATIQLVSTITAVVYDSAATKARLLDAAYDE